MLGFEALLTVVAMIVLNFTVNSETASSVALGGLAYIVPNMYFAKYVFRHSAAKSVHLAMRWFYVGEGIKIITTALIFTAAFLWTENLNEAALFATYVVMLVLNIWGNSVLMSR